MLTTLPKTAGNQNPAWPGVYSDHFLFYETLQEPYHCPEQPAALGLLMSRQGNCDYWVNGSRNRVQAGQLFLVNSQSRLAVQTAKKQSAPALLFFHSRFPDLVRHSLEQSDEKLLEQNSAEGYHDFSYLERMHENPALIKTIDTLVALGSSCSSFASLKADIMIRNLFEKLLRENQSAAQLAKNISVIKLSTRLEIFKRISLTKEWIAANSSSVITLEEMAVIASMNSQHFLRMFRQVYGITPHQYLIHCKLEKAKELLRSTHMPVLMICQEIGFESVYSFTLLFRKRFGIPPARYRKDEI